MCVKKLRTAYALHCKSNNNNKIRALIIFKNIFLMILWTGRHMVCFIYGQIVIHIHFMC